MSHKPHCPKCRTVVLEEKTVSDGTLIDICPTCRGAWFDARELETVLSVAVEKLAAPEDAPKTGRICPKCGIQLTLIHYPETKIEVDICEQCAGLWLDRGEFKALNVARAKYQDEWKFEEPPKNRKEAATRFLTKVIDRLMKSS